jgi:hypothetical protein
VGKPEERDHLEDPGIDGRVKLKWIFKKCVGRALTGLIWLRIMIRWQAHVNAIMNLWVP